MRERTERKHVIDFLFPLALFFVLTATSVALVVLASGTYSRQVQDSEDSFASRTALSYVMEKIHLADEYGAVYAGTFDGQDAIVIRQTYSEYDGYLRELFIQDGVDAKASDGRRILASDCFSFDETQDGLFHLYCTNKDGSISDTYVSIKSTS